MASWVIDLIHGSGYWGVALLMFLETVFPPIPSELIMPLAGYLAAQGGLSIWGVIASGTFGATVGATVLYAVGRMVRLSTLENWADRYGRWLTISRPEMEKTVHWFKNHGGYAVFLGRILPGLRSLISVPAGLAKMNLLPFLVWTAGGTLLWTALLAGAGFALGYRFHAVGEALDPIGWAVFALFAIWYAVRVVRHPTKTKRHRTGKPPNSSRSSHVD